MIAGYLSRMSTDQNQSTPVDPETVTDEAESAPDSVRSTDDSENLEEAILDDQIDNGM